MVVAIFVELVPLRCTHDLQSVTLSWHLPQPDGEMHNEAGIGFIENRFIAGPHPHLADVLCGTSSFLGIVLAQRVRNG